MADLNWWLMALAFLLGLLLTFAMMIRRVTREVPVNAAVSVKPEPASVTAATPLKATAHRAEKDDRILQNEPYGAGSIRVSARAQAPTGYTIKGDKDTGRYFTRDSPEYAAIEAEVWFADEDSAARAGFLRWDAKGDQKTGLAPAAAATVIKEGPVADTSMVIVESVFTDSDSTSGTASGPETDEPRRS